jgi:hypothetical protein
MSTSDPLNSQSANESAEEETQPLITAPPASQQAYPPPVPGLPERSQPVRNAPRRSTLRWLVGIVALAMALAMALVAGWVGVNWWQASLPKATVASFCGAVTRQDFAGAYRRLVGAAGIARTQADFTHNAQEQDQLDGHVRACAVVTSGSAANALSQAPQTMTLQIARNHTYSGSLTLVRDGVGWKIGALDEAALGPAVAPWDASQRFCAALAAGDFASAYSALSRQGQADASQADFTSAFSDALASSKAQIASCQLSVTSYVAQPTAATVVATLMVRVTTANGAVSAPVVVRIALVNEAGVWKVDRVQPFSGT